MNVVILYDAVRLTLNRRFAEFLHRAFASRGIDAETAVAETIDDWAGREIPDLVVMRSVNPSLSAYLESKGARVWNDSFVARICNDKWATYGYLRERGIESLPTRLVTRETLVSGPFDFPGVLKSRDGHGGTEVFWAKNRVELMTAFQKIGQKSAVWQSPASDLGKDLRVYVLGKKIVVAMLRESNDGFRSNFCLGASASVYPLSEEEKRRVDQITDLFSFGLAGIDFIFHQGRVVINEIEDVVGSRMIYSRTDLDIASLYVDFMLRTL